MHKPINTRDFPTFSPRAKKFIRFSSFPSEMRFSQFDSFRLDKTLQDIVYKLVPELFLKEMTRRKQFYQQHPDISAKVSPEERGEDTERTIFNPQDLISLSLEYVRWVRRQESLHIILLTSKSMLKFRIIHLGRQRANINLIIGTCALWCETFDCFIILIRWIHVIWAGKIF